MAFLKPELIPFSCEPRVLSKLGRPCANVGIWLQGAPPMCALRAPERRVYFCQNSDAPPAAVLGISRARQAGHCALEPGDLCGFSRRGSLNERKRPYPVVQNPSVCYDPLSRGSSRLQVNLEFRARRDTAQTEATAAGKKLAQKLTRRRITAAAMPRHSMRRQVFRRPHFSPAVAVSTTHYQQLLAPPVPRSRCNHC